MIGRFPGGVQKILVAMDDSNNARAALRWALDQAGGEDVVIALHVWHMPMLGGFDGAYLDPTVFENAAVESLAEVVADVVTDDERGRVEERVVRGVPAQMLIEEGGKADLLVLGSRGHGGFTGLLMGSVSSSVVHHAPCPVVIVPLNDGAD